MAMTGGTSKLLKTTYPFSDKSKAVNLYAYYKSTQSVDTNKSTVYCGMYVTTPSGWDIGTWNDTAGASYIGTTSNTFDGTIPNFSGTRWLAENKTFTVTHNADGTGKATIQWKWNVNSTWGSFVYPSGSFTIDLPTIPRASVPTLSASTVEMGKTITVYTNRKSTAFKHSIELWFAGERRKQFTNVTDSYTFDVPLDLATKIPSKPSGTATIKCTTYKDSVTNTIGSPVEKTFTATVPNNATTQPKASFALTPIGSLPSAFSGLFIQGKTGVVADFNASSEYSTIASYSMTVEGKAYSGDPATSNILTKDGNVTVTGVVKDARGYSNTSLAKTITVYPYRSPSLADIVCERSLQDKTYDDAGTYLHIKARRVYEPIEVDGVEKNHCSIYYQYKAQDGGWSDEIPLLSGDDLTTDVYDAAIPDVVSQVDKSYAVKLIARDTIGGDPATYDFYVPTAEVSLHLDDSGYGVAVGKYSEATPDRKMFEVANDWEFVVGDTAVVDFVIEEGTSGIWTYRKWSSGVAECWCKHTQTLDISTSWAVGWYTTGTSGFTLALPTSLFKDTPHFDITFTGSHGAIVWAHTQGSAVNTPNIMGVRPTSVTGVELCTNIYALGRWK